MHSKKCPGSIRAVENCHMIHSLYTYSQSESSSSSPTSCQSHQQQSLQPPQSPTSLPTSTSLATLPGFTLSLPLQQPPRCTSYAPHNVRRREKRLRVKIKELEQQNKELSIKLQTKDKLISSLKKQLASERVTMKAKLFRTKRVNKRNLNKKKAVSPDKHQTGIKRQEAYTESSHSPNCND